MLQLCIIGLPDSLRNRLVAEAKRRKLALTPIIAAIGKLGSYHLRPNSKQASYFFSDYTSQLKPDMSDGYVIVLPYASVSEELEDELDAYNDLGGEIHDDIYYWPELKGRPDTAFLNSLFSGIIATLPASITGSPSNFFEQASRLHSSLLLAPGALSECDGIAEHRHEFMQRAADAMTKLVTSGHEGRIEIFFEEHGLTHAQSGGIESTLKVILKRNKQVIYNKKSYTHLKQGDKTSKSAAARIYYHHFIHDEKPHIVITYAGPHPEKSVSSEIYLEK